MKKSPRWPVYQETRAQGPADRVITWSTVEDKAELMLAGHKEHVTLLAFSKKGRFLASASPDDRQVRIWDAHSGALLSVLPSAPNTPISLAFGGEHDSVAIGTETPGVCLWDWRNDFLHVGWHCASRADALNLRFDVHGNGVIRDKSKEEDTTDWYTLLYEMWDGYRTTPLSFNVCTSSADGTLQAFRWINDTIVLNNGILSMTLDGHVGLVLALRFTHDNKHLVSVGADGMGRFWNTKTGICERVFVTRGHCIIALACSPTGAIATVSDERVICLWR